MSEPVPAPLALALLPLRWLPRRAAVDGDLIWANRLPSLGDMLRRLAILLAALALGLAPARALAAPVDVASTHAYLVAGYAALHATVTTWSAIQTSIHKLNRRFAAECPNVGAGSPQNEESQKMSNEVAGALWATGYHTDAKIARTFVRAVQPLRWSNPAITRIARKFTKGLLEMVALQVPDLCGDVRAWSATGFATIPARTLAYDRHVEAIEVKEIPPRLLRPYVQPADKALAARDERLNTQFQNLETSTGFNDWDLLLETLALNQ
jgi:hypothetical protein